MGLDKEMDRRIDQAGESIEKGMENIFSGTSTYNKLVGVGMREFFQKKLFKQKSFALMILFVFSSSLVARYVEIKYLMDLNHQVWEWLYHRQTLIPYPLPMISGLFLLSLYFNRLGKKKEELRERFILAFERCGLSSRVRVNKVPEYPFLIKDEFTRDGGQTFIFKNPGLPLNDWISKKENLEVSLEDRISSIDIYRNNPGRIMIKLGGSEIPTSVEITDELMSKTGESSIVVGVSNQGPVTHDFTSIPHILAAGATGAGKTVVVSFIGYQCIKYLNGLFYLIDFKGGADYTDFEDLGIDIVSERESVVGLLKALMVEHNERVKLFKSNGVKNIAEYNAKIKKASESNHKHLRRVFVLIDELAELTDRKSAPKDEHDLLDMIEGQLSSIARLCRSTGIHLILSTQRPDANVIPGQIKNNVPGRLCGYFKDDIAYRIVLDYIPHPRLPSPVKQKGRFLYSLGAEDVYIQVPHFQSHHIDKGFKMDYSTGMITSISDAIDDHGVSPIPSQQRRRHNIEDS